MGQQLRIVLVVVASLAGLGLSVVLTGPIKSRMLRLSGDRIGRALLVTVGFFLTGLLLAIVLGIVAALLQEAGLVAAMVVVMCLGIVVLAPFAIVYLSPVTPETPMLPPTESGDLGRRGATPGVARAIGWTGAVLSLVPGLAVVFTFGGVALVVGR